MKNTILYFCLLLSQALFAQLPNTDIWLLDIKATKDTIILSNPVNITNRAGYDNQPSFSPDGTYILYTSIRDEKQSDIYKYDLKTKQITQFTNTSATSEYSPTFMPDGKNISVVMVEPDSVQRLWKFPLKGGAPSLVMDKVDSIGYHCWINKDSLALIMITEPPTLVTVNTKTQFPREYRKRYPDDSLSYGRCITYSKRFKSLFYSWQRKPYEYCISNSLTDHTPKTECKTKPSPHMYGETQDFALWELKDFPLYVFGVKSQLLILDDFLTGDLVTIMDYKDLGIKNITRIAISPDGTKMAIVAE